MTYQIIYVTFMPDGREYSYLTDDETIAAGDHVIVPTGGENEEKLARVTRTDTVTEETAPYPVGKMKKVLRKLSANFMDDDAMPASISDAIAGTLREKITEWTDWGTNQCIAPEEDFDTYRELVLKGAEKGWTEALEALAYASYGGNNVFPSNWKKSEECLLKLIEMQEDPLPSYYNTLGYIYYYGRTTGGVPQYEKAFQYFSIGAIHGVYESRYKLADMLLEGKGVPKNVAAAAILVKSIYQENKEFLEEGEMDTKFADVALRLGGLYERGLGVEQDLDTAYGLYLQAEFAIRERMKKWDFYGDKSVAEHIEEALTRVRGALPEDYFQTSYHSEGPHLIGQLLTDSEGLDMAVTVRNDVWYLLAKRADVDEDGKTRKMLFTLPSMNICTLTDTIVLRIDEPDEVKSMSPTGNGYVNHISLVKDDGRWLFLYQDHPIITVKCKGFSFEL